MNLPVNIIQNETEDFGPAATFTPWTDGYAVGFHVTVEGEPDTYVYLEPCGNENLVWVHSNSDGQSEDPRTFITIN